MIYDEKGYLGIYTTSNHLFRTHVPIIGYFP